MYSRTPDVTSFHFYMGVSYADLCFACILTFVFSTLNFDHDVAGTWYFLFFRPYWLEWYLLVNITIVLIISYCQNFLIELHSIYLIKQFELFTLLRVALTREVDLVFTLLLNSAKSPFLSFL